LVPNGNIVFGGSGASRTVTITPAANQSGAATIILTVSDGTLTASDAVVVTVNAVNDPPTISNIADQSTGVGTPVGPLSFTVGDVETAAGSLTVSGSSSNPTLVPNGNIAFGGSGSSRTVTVTPAAGQTGSTTITVNVSDGTLSAIDTFVLTVNGVNTAPTISDIADQTIDEDATTGALTFTVGDGQTAAASLLVSGSSSDPTLVPNGNIVFGGSGASRTVTLTPAANQSGVATISITVSDGTLTSSDSLVLTVNAVNDPPTISNLADQSTVTDTAVGPLAFTVGDVETAATSLTVSGSSSNPTLVPNGNIVFGGSGSSRTVTVTPAPGQVGSATITVTVSDGSLSATDVFVLTVNGVNTPPTISNVPDQTISEDGTTGALSFTVGDGQTAPGSLAVSGGSSNPTLVPNGNIVFGGSGANRTVTITPAANQSGTATITITVSDGTLTASDAVVVTVNAVNDPPTISNIADQSTGVGTPVGPLSFTVGDVETAAGSLTVSSSSSNPTLVPNGNIAFGGSGSSRTVTVTPAAGQSGSATITVTVSDGNLTANDTFVVSVSSLVVGTRSFTNATTTTVPALGLGVPYPSAINVSGMGGVISTVTVELRSISHTYPADMDVLLVGPNGQKAMILSDVGGSTVISGVTVTLSDAASTSLTAGGRILTGTYKPSDVEPGENGDLDTFTAPAPAGPYTSALSVFNGQGANGAWSL